jgi:hypothetical protein
MPRHREGPIKNQQTSYYYFDQYVGLGPDRQRMRISFRKKYPADLNFSDSWRE